MKTTVNIIEDTYNQTSTFDRYNLAYSKVEVLSFDIWETLLTQNPEFSQKRNKFVGDYFFNSELRNETGYGFVRTAWKTANDIVDAIQEVHGQQVRQKTRVQIMLNQLIQLLQLGGHHGQIIPKDLAYSHPVIMCSFINDIESIFLDNLPKLLHYNTANIIKEYRERVPVAFVSNTGMLSGKVMRQAFEKLGLEADYYYFSDEIGVAKPRVEMFAGLKSIPGVTDYKNILHVGDSLTADIKGAEAAGISSLHFVSGGSFIIRDGDDTPALAWQRPGEPITLSNITNIAGIVDFSQLNKSK